jgi:hypothetical protein
VEEEVEVFLPAWRGWTDVSGKEDEKKNCEENRTGKKISFDESYRRAVSTKGMNR